MAGELLVAGGGIGGLAAALAARKAGWEAQVFEQADALSEAGAGIQLGPNVTRILGEWGLLRGEFAARASRPSRLLVRDALTGAQLGQLPFSDFESRYGAPYLTVHRVDLQATLLRAAEAAGVRLHTGRKVGEIVEIGRGVRVETLPGPAVEGEALVGADGLWSTVRTFVAGSEAPRVSGHLAYRGLVPGVRQQEVTVWLAPAMHLVTYSVRGGECLNVVCVVEGQVDGDPRAWDHEALAANLETAAGTVCGEAREVLRSVPAWRLWALHDRPAVAGPEGMARGRVALLGDAAHPMRPYLAQGAGMAIEDARWLQQVLSVTDDRVLDVPTALRRYALDRWQRAARVQRKSERNGVIFHAAGPLRLSRNIAMRALGGSLLDQPWLYGE